MIFGHRRFITLRLFERSSQAQQSLDDAIARSAEDCRALADGIRRAMARAIKVLIVDGDPAARDGLAECLPGAEVVICDDPGYAAKLIGRERFCCAVVGLAMAERSHLIRALRLRWPGIPVALLLGTIGDDSHRLMAEVGANAVFCRPLGGEFAAWVTALARGHA